MKEILIILWFIIVIVNAFYIQPYKQLKPIERVNGKWILWSDNWELVNNPKRIDLLIKGWYRWFFNKQYTFEQLRKKYNDAGHNFSPFASELYKAKRYTDKIINP